MSWKKSGEVFDIPNDDTYNAVLKARESRVVFFRAIDDDQLNSSNADSIKIGFGEDNTFHVSLKNGHFSEKVICSGFQVINTAVLDTENSDIISYSKRYQFLPQTTTYLQVAVSKTGSPLIQQVSADEALPLLKQSVRQTHQISRFSPNCTTLYPVQDSIREPINPSITDTPLHSQVETKNPTQFNVLFDFDSTNIKNNDEAVFAGMANFIQTYPKNNVTLEGHTDNRGSQSYNLKLSQSRADTVKGILVDQYGLEATRLRAIGYGESAPIDNNDTEQGRQNNRRVVATINDVNN